MKFCDLIDICNSDDIIIYIYIFVGKQPLAIHYDNIMVIDGHLTHRHNNQSRRLLVYTLQ